MIKSHLNVLIWICLGVSIEVYKLDNLLCLFDFMIYETFDFVCSRG